MLGNYLTTALRLLWRERGYAAINIFGLAVGFCLCLLTVQLAAYQLSVGDFHEKKDRVFRVLGPDFWSEAQYTGSLPGPLGPTLKEQLPEVEEAVRFSSVWPHLLRAGDKEGIYEKVSGAEAGVFDMFSLPLLRGDPKTALARPYTMVLTEPLARRLFGEERSHRTGRPRREARLRSYRHRRSAARQFIAPVFGATLLRHGVQGEPGNDGLERFCLQDLCAANA